MYFWTDFNVQQTHLLQHHKTCIHRSHSNKLCSLYCGRHNMPPPRASGDLNSHPELSAWRSLRMSMMQVFAFHCVCAWSHRACRDAGNPSVYQFEVRMAFPFRRYGWYSVTVLSSLAIFTFDRLFSKWDQVSSCPGHPSRQFSACSRVKVRIATDRPTDRWQSSGFMSAPYGGGA